MQSFERSSYPPIAEYAFLSDCEVAALVAPSGNVEWLCLPQFDSPSVFCPILDRDVGRFRIGPGRRAGARSAPLPAGQHGARDHLEDAHRLARRARRALHRAMAPRRRARPPAAPRAGRLGGRARAGAHGALPAGNRRAAARVRAGVRVRADRRPSGPTPARPTTRRARPAASRRSTCCCTRTCGSASRARAPPPAPRCARATPRSWRCRGPSTAGRRTSTRRSSGWTGPPSTGASGSRTATSRTIRGGRCSSAAR